MLEVSVIISVYNDWKWLEMILSALQRQTFRNFEVVIADDGSGEEMVAAIQNATKENSFYSFPIIHTWHEDHGWRKDTSLNNAVRVSNGKYLIFIDGDCIPHRRLVEEHLAAQTPRRVIAGRRAQLTAKMSESLTSCKVSAGYLERNMIPIIWGGLTGKAKHSENCIRLTSPLLRHFIREHNEGLLGCNFSISKADLMTVNGFDERYQAPGIGEDTDLEARLKRAGIFVKTLKHMITVYHKEHASLGFYSPENHAIYDENNRLEVAYTPYGINRVDRVD